MAPVCLCGAALPEKMYGDRAKCKRVDEFDDVTGHHLCEPVHTVAGVVEDREKKNQRDFQKPKKEGVYTGW
jgi:hypothetical protein